MENLLLETRAFLKAYGKSVKDVMWVGSEKYGYFSWKTFTVLANHKYDSGFGSQSVAKDLLVVGKDFWLERYEYDGSEGWEYNTMPVKPKKRKVPSKIMGGMWESLEVLNSDENI